MFILNDKAGVLSVGQRILGIVVRAISNHARLQFYVRFRRLFASDSSFI